ncbi:hypothetical protein [Methylobacterium sp. 275MFSha3.1]|uniref:hypothetical protein n=1 Tax=Methylobacterium sp. 275MFSha3.1 TaxID=1502746 RepID=UPI000B8394D3|nr:hypothetical protein [Methylobacterium sp. 275MFSha3.1]
MLTTRDVRQYRTNAIALRHGRRAAGAIRADAPSRAAAEILEVRADRLEDLRSVAGSFGVARGSARALAAIRAILLGARPGAGADVLFDHESPSSKNNHSENGFAEIARIDHRLGSLK